MNDWMPNRLDDLHKWKIFPDKNLSKPIQEDAEALIILITKKNNSHAVQHTILFLFNKEQQLIKDKKIESVIKNPLICIVPDDFTSDYSRTQRSLKLVLKVNFLACMMA